MTLQSVKSLSKYEHYLNPRVVDIHMCGSVSLSKPFKLAKVVPYK